MLSGKQYTLHLDVPVIGILRGVEADALSFLMQASFSAGLQAIEVTLNSPEAEAMIAANRDRVPAGKYLAWELSATPWKPKRHMRPVQCFLSLLMQTLKS